MRKISLIYLIIKFSKLKSALAIIIGSFNFYNFYKIHFSKDFNINISKSPKI